MKLKYFILSAIFLSVLNNVDAQGNEPISIFGIQNLNNYLKLAIQEKRILANSYLAPGIPWSRVTGSPFWNDNWRLASLYDKNDKIIATLPVRLNLNTSSVHYIDQSGEELSLDPDGIRKVVFLQDTIAGMGAVFISYVPYAYFGETKNNNYLQVMNEGMASLLVYRQKFITSGDSASPGHQRYFYTKEVAYYIALNGKVERLKRTGKEQVFMFLPGANAMDRWINENKLNLKKEEDIVKFINYYNSQKK